MPERPYHAPARHLPAATALAGDQKARSAGQAPQASAQPSPTRVLVVDDHVVVRNGIAFSLFAFNDIEIVGQACSGEQALRWCDDAEALPNVVLLDLKMPGMSGIATIQELRARYPQTQVVVLTSYQEGDLVEEALHAGATSYLLKDVAIEELARAIRLAHRGTPTLAPAAAQALVHTVAHRPAPLGHDLTDREREVLALMAEGLPNQQIAERLVITTATVKFHTRSIRGKLGATSRTETVVLALQYHLTPTSV